MVKEISIKKVQDDAEEVFKIGGFYCSEAIVYSVRNNIDPEMPAGLVAAASGFPIGVGGSKCLCGAISGAVICLGYFFGRTEPGVDSNKCCSTGEPDPKSEKTLDLVDELQESFRKNHKGVLCCNVHVQGMDMASPERKCIAFTGEMAAKTAEILARELELKVL
jgi:C_GCAxxG_C_C family probable redox protein